MNSDECPIFPLKSIVLPGGVFPLRIFERRYLDMVTKCIKEDTGFCIALVQKEDRNKYIDQVYEIMSYVEITDWNKLEDGILGISVEGKSLAKVKKCELNKDNLLIGQVDIIKPEKEFMVPQKYQLLSKFYRKIYPGIKDYINFSNLLKLDFFGYTILVIFLIYILIRIIIKNLIIIIFFILFFFDFYFFYPAANK